MKYTDKMTFIYFLFIITSCIGIICVIFELPTLICYLTIIIYMYAFVSIIKFSYCPYCDKYSRPVKAFLKEKPCCKICGRNFDD